ncbi:CRISPR-associated protein Cas4 [Amycolatopsis sp. SB7-3]|uniref:CRISPR-associated protein Cas4 n=1 Tax=Amycolatopsis sp. SB7-3 TaxID=3373438 RepID=UPI00374484D2
MAAHGEDLRSVPISALEHYAYCPRQATLIHAESYFQSNVDTVRGDLAHAAVDRIGPGSDRNRQKVWRSLPVWSDTVGIHGVCDIVQFTADGPQPVEHKSGRYHSGGPADLQVAAQVLCLREMFDADVPYGVVFSGRDRRRHQIDVDNELAGKVVEGADAVRELLESGLLPGRAHESRCRRCSLRPGCVPELPRSVLNTLFTPRAEGDWND